MYVFCFLPRMLNLVYMHMYNSAIPIITQRKGKSWKPSSEFHVNHLLTLQICKAKLKLCISKHKCEKCYVS